MKTVKHIDIITCKDQYENVQIIDMCNQNLFFAHKTRFNQSDSIINRKPV